MKYLMTGILCMLISLSLLGQGKTSISLDAGFPLGAGSGDVSTGIGVSLMRENRIDNHLSWLVTAGYMYFYTSPTIINAHYTGHYNFVPIQMGVKYYPKDCFKGFYIGTSVGITLISLEATESNVIPPPTITAHENKFTFTPQIGVHGVGADFGIMYNFITDANYIGAKLSLMLNK